MKEVQFNPDTHFLANHASSSPTLRRSPHARCGLGVLRSLETRILTLRERTSTSVYVLTLQTERPPFFQSSFSLLFKSLSEAMSILHNFTTGNMAANNVPIADIIAMKLTRHLFSGRTGCIQKIIIMAIAECRKWSFHAINSVGYDPSKHRVGPHLKRDAVVWRQTRDIRHCALQWRIVSEQL